MEELTNDEKYELIYNKQALAIGLIQDEKYEEVIEKLLEVADDISKCEEDCSDFQMVHYNIGVCHFQLNNFEKAVESLTKSIETENFKCDAYARLGFCYLTNDQYSEAVDMYHKSLMLHYNSEEGGFLRVSAKLVFFEMFLAMTSGYTGDDGVELLDLLYIARTVIVTDNENKEVYNYIAMILKEIEKNKNLSSKMFKKSIEKELQKKAQLIYKRDELSNSECKLFFDEFTNYLRNDDRFELFFKCFINFYDNAENEILTPSFNSLKTALYFLWENGKENHLLKLEVAFGEKAYIEVKPTINIKGELQNLIFEETKTEEDTETEEETEITRGLIANSLEEACDIMEAYFYKRELLNEELWKTNVGDEIMQEKIKKLAPMVQQIFATMSETEKSVIKINVSDVEPDLLDSKFGGIPYLPLKAEIPKSANGEGLYLLAQINLEQLPSGSFLIKQGMLQFWILDDDLYGADFDDATNQKDFRVVYYKDIEEHYSEKELLEKYKHLTEQEYSPLEKGVHYKLDFMLAKEQITTEDYLFEEKFLQRWKKTFKDTPLNKLYDLPDEVIEDIYNEYSGDDHKLLGYPYFTQSDPREYANHDYILLLQINSEDEIMWGDCGVGNFFIAKEDLENADFSKVMYCWDCG